MAGFSRRRPGMRALKERHRSAAEIADRLQSGFSFVELILVIILVLILASMLVPRYSRDAITKHKVYASAHDLAADLRYARRLAIGGGQDGQDENPFWLTLSANPAAGATNTWKIYEDGNPGNPLKTVTALEEIEFLVVGAATDSFRFDRDGAPTPDSAAIDVADSGGLYRWRVSVVRSTGRVTLSEM
ncbi:MAG TPA: GspH/FimT family pseudopilin [bacterium]|mgnify:FL=1|nr:GspH/FimT family pseudopilin [bacterium]